MLFDPRILMRVPVPVVPLLLSTCTPGARPEIRLVNSVIGACSATFAASIVVTVFPISSLRCSPVAVATISSSCTGAAVMARSAVALAPAVTTTVSVTGR